MSPLPNSTAIVNSACGIDIHNGIGNTIGGIHPGEGNTIAYNGSIAQNYGFCGVFITSSDPTLPIGINNSIRGNSIFHNYGGFGNQGFGIELGQGGGGRPNDLCDGDMGPNKMQNYPVLTSISSSAESTTILGTLNSTPSKTFAVDFYSNSSCDPSGYGEGQTFIGTANVTTDSSCNSTISIQLPVGNLSGKFITATATDPSGNTSEFSACLQATPPPPTPTPTPTPIQLILDTSGPAVDQVAALDSILFLRDPFPVVNGADLLNLGSDPNTRVIVFVTNLQLAQGEPSSSVVVNLVDSNNQSYDIAAEDVRPVPAFNFTQVIFRLPDNLATGTCTIKVKAHGQTSNAGTIRIRI